MWHLSFYNMLKITFFFVVCLSVTNRNVTGFFFFLCQKSVSLLITEQEQALVLYHLNDKINFLVTWETK